MKKENSSGFISRVKAATMADTLISDLGLS